MVIIMAKKLVYGVGFNDSDCKLSTTAELNGKRVVTWQCDFYSKWLYMLQRCYSKSFQKSRPSYIGCSVCNEWLTFSNFKAWMEIQDWRGKELDKDIIFAGNKIYCPDSCAFVSRLVNSFFGSKNNFNGYLDGVSVFKRDGTFKSQAQNPFTNKNEHIGYFSSDIAAHLAWKKRKHDHAVKLADMQTDPRVAQALRTRYL